MPSIQQQYNVVPGQYAKEMASVSVIPHLKSIAVEMVTYLFKPSSVSCAAKIEVESKQDI